MKCQSEGQNQSQEIEKLQAKLFKCTERSSVFSLINSREINKTVSIFVHIGQTVNFQIKPFYCRIDKLALDPDRKELLTARANAKGKGKKHKEKDVNMVE